MANNMKQTYSHIAILPSLGISHLIPFLELAKRLVIHHDLHVTCICLPDDQPTSDATKAVLESLPKPNAQTIFLPPVNLDDVPNDARPGTKSSLTMTRSLPSIQHVLKSLSPNVIAFFVDPFGIDALDIAKELDISTFVFFPINATGTSLLLHLAQLDKIAAPYDFMRDLPEPVKLPGCPPLRGGDLFNVIQDRRSDGYKKFVKLSKRIVSGEGIKGFVVNSFLDIEFGAIKALQEGQTGNLTIYPVGPIVRTASTGQKDEDNSKCLTWLDNQPRGSVLYVSFGSFGTLSLDQVAELAFGLEMSGQRFIWVVRKPNGLQGSFETLDFLPSGFVERTKGRGLVLRYWAPQVQVLAHASTGGFLSHCGWSSTLESLVHGVPLIAWPLAAEQKVNAVVLVESLKVALRPKTYEDGLIRREEIAHIVKVLMEGTSEEARIARDRTLNIKDSAAKALGEDGSSTKALSELALALKNLAAK